MHTVNINEIDPYGEENWNDNDEIFEILNKIKDVITKYIYDPGELILEEENMSEDAIKKLMRLGFFVDIYNDSNEYSDYFWDLVKIKWNHK